MIELPESEYIQRFLDAGGKKHWWGYPRGFQWNKEIYINKEAYFFNDRDYKLLIGHETFHLNSKPHPNTLAENLLGEDHTWYGLMSPWGPVRFLTTTGQF